MDAKIRRATHDSNARRAAAKPSSRGCRLSSVDTHTQTRSQSILGPRRDREDSLVAHDRHGVAPRDLVSDERARQRTAALAALKRRVGAACEALDRPVNRLGAGRPQKPSKVSSELRTPLARFVTLPANARSDLRLERDEPRFEQAVVGRSWARRRTLALQPTRRRIRRESRAGAPWLRRATLSRRSSRARGAERRERRRRLRASATRSRSSTARRTERALSAQRSLNTGPRRRPRATGPTLGRRAPVR